MSKWTKQLHWFLVMKIVDWLSNSFVTKFKSYFNLRKVVQANNRIHWFKYFSCTWTCLESKSWCWKTLTWCQTSRNKNKQTLVIFILKRCKSYWKNAHITVTNVAIVKNANVFAETEKAPNYRNRRREMQLNSWTQWKKE